METRPAPAKIYFIDNLRVLMTVLVILHHTLIAYGAPGGWYFTDATHSKPALLLMTILVATNQSFFMGFFFFLSAYFTEPSYNKKGAGRFVADRLKRLGVPLLFYAFVLSPVMNYLVYHYGRHKPIGFLPFLRIYDEWIQFGVLWFVIALLLFTLLYVAWRQWGKATPGQPSAFPTNAQLLLFAVLLGVASYAVRIFFPLGWVLKPLGFQLSHFAQYISLFCLGIVAHRNQWMNRIPATLGRRWRVATLVLVLVVFPLLLLSLAGEMDKFIGHGTWQSLVAALWEQLTGISIILALSGFASHRWNYTTPLLQGAARAAFATYIFHPLVVISITLLLLPWSVDPVLKLLVAAPCGIALSFGLGWLITRLPLAKDIV